MDPSICLHCGEAITSNKGKSVKTSTVGKLPNVTPSTTVGDGLRQLGYSLSSAIEIGSKSYVCSACVSLISRTIKAKYYFTKMESVLAARRRTSFQKMPVCLSLGVISKNLSSPVLLCRLPVIVTTPSLETGSIPTPRGIKRPLTVNTPQQVHCDQLPTPTARKKIRKSSEEPGPISDKIQSRTGIAKTVSDKKPSRTVIAKTVPLKKTPEHRYTFKMHTKHLITRGRYGAAMRHLLLKSAVAKEQFCQVVTEAVRRDITALRTNGKVVKQKISLETVENFSWHNILEELETIAPVFIASLIGAVVNRKNLSLVHHDTDPRKNGKRVPGLAAVAMQLLYLRSPHVFKYLQSHNSIMLHKNGSSQQLESAFQHMGICLGVTGTRSTVNRITADYDKKVKNWCSQIKAIYKTMSKDDDSIQSDLHNLEDVVKDMECTNLSERTNSDDNSNKNGDLSHDSSTSPNSLVEAQRRTENPEGLTTDIDAPS